MKTILAKLTVFTLAGAAILMAACGTVDRASETVHENKTYAQTTNSVPWIRAAFRKDPYSILVQDEVWRDRNKGSGHEMLNVQALAGATSTHTNQAALGGGNTLGVTGLAVDVSTNAAPTIGAAGTATGNVIGAAAAAAAKKVVTP